MWRDLPVLTSGGVADLQVVEVSIPMHESAYAEASGELRLGSKELMHHGVNLRLRPSREHGMIGLGREAELRPEGSEVVPMINERSRAVKRRDA